MYPVENLDSKNTVSPRFTQSVLVVFSNFALLACMGSNRQFPRLQTFAFTLLDTTMANDTRLCTILVAGVRAVLAYI